MRVMTQESKGAPLSEELKDALRKLASRPKEEQLAIIARIPDGPAAVREIVGNEGFPNILVIVVEIARLIDEDYSDDDIIRSLSEVLDDVVASALLSAVKKTGVAIPEVALTKYSPQELGKLMEQAIFAWLRGEEPSDNRDLAAAMALCIIFSRPLLLGLTLEDIKEDLIESGFNEQQAEVIISVLHKQEERIRFSTFYKLLLGLDLSLRTLSERVDELTKNIGELANLLRHLFKQSEQRWGRYIS